MLPGLLALLLALLSVPIATQQRAAAGEGPGLRPQMQLSLASLGVPSDPVLTARTSRLASVVYPYDLPPGTRQGPDVWLLLDLVGDVAFSKGSRGTFQLTGDMNGFVAASIDLDVRPGGDVETHTLSLIGGSSRRVSSERQAHVEFSNYAQINGVRPGPGKLTYKIKPLQGAEGEARVVLRRSGTGLRVTSASPYEVGLGLPGRPLTAAPGTMVEVPYTLKRRGQQQDGPVTVSLKGVSAEGLAPVGDTEAHYSDIGVGRRGSFRFKAQSDGTYRVTLAAVGTYNPASGTADVIVSTPVRRANWLVIVPLGALTAIGLLWAIQPLLRARRQQHAGGPTV